LTHVGRVCVYCGVTIWGRSDKAFCTTACRVAAARRRHQPPQLPQAELLVTAVDPVRLETALLGVIARSTDWRAAAWLLEHSFSERWGSVASGDGRAERYRGDRFAAVDELAERRARKADGY
jgi:hypothetical protein